MDVNQLKVQAFDLIAAKEKHLKAVDQLNKELQIVLDKMAELEASNNGIKQD